VGWTRAGGRPRVWDAGARAASARAPGLARRDAGGHGDAGARHGHAGGHRDAGGRRDAGATPRPHSRPIHQAPPGPPARRFKPRRRRAEDLKNVDITTCMTFVLQVG